MREEDVPRSFIKNVALQISEAYKFDNAPYSDEDKEKKPVPFIGRKRAIEKFLEFLNGNEKKGVFLVAGYKGMGKTSFVNHVINRYKNVDDNDKKRRKWRKNLIIPIHLTLTQNNPKEIDILRLLVSSIYEKYNIYRYRNLRAKIISLSATTWIFLVKLSLFIFLFLAGVIATLKLKACSECVIVDDLFKFKLVKQSVDAITPWLLPAFSAFLLIFIFLKIRVYRARKKDSPYSRIKRLMERCYASLSEESTDEDDFSIANIKARFGGSEKRIKSYPIAGTKEIEFELQQFFKKINDSRFLLFWKRQIEFIFIFDELDKIDSVASSSYLYEGLETNESKKAEASYEREMRDRKQAIVNIIASLKNFFTTAPARFIFIAGREMFDASLADIADRQSSISSIFTYIFNIESLLKETELEPGSNRSSLSSAIELYLKRLLFAESDKDKKVSTKIHLPQKKQATKALYQLAEEKYLEQIKNRKDFELIRGKLYFTLQNFVTFLTYRSNGSPQKLIKTIHEFILVKEGFDSDHGKNIIYKQAHSKSKLYLHFNYENQYRIGFINYLYQPFIIKWGSKLKFYSDNIVVSTPYLFDHLLKFHPFAFSLENLEMIPEVLSTNKTPFLRKHIRMLVDHLSSSHIRETEISLFEYKFYSRTINEIDYLSKIFEPEAAAYNFTLDESHTVKLHIAGKIKGLRNVYYKFLGNSDVDYQIFSIAHLSEVLGDLHFFDEEYDDAITAYSDSIKALGRLSIGEKTDVRDFVALIKNKLKMGLCFEKTNSYEEALAAYSDCCNDAKNFMVGRLIKGRPFDISDLHEYYDSKGRGDKDFKEVVFYGSSLSNLLQMILQGYLAKIFMQEKIGIEGISNLKLSIAVGSFLKMFDGFIDAQSRNHLLKANVYTFIGKLLYFKNNQVEFELKNSLNEYKKILPIDFLNQISNIIKNSQHFIKVNPGETKPVSALSMYVLSFYEVVSTKYESSLVREIQKLENGNEQTMGPCLIKVLITDAESYIKEENSKFRAVHYRYIATLLSNIGDCLLGTYKPLKISYNKFTIEHLFYTLDEDVLDNKLETEGFADFLRKSAENEIDLADILRCYYLSGRYFLKYGRKISCSFQYNKILHVLRMTLTAGEPSINGFLKILEKTIVSPLLEMASDVSGGIDAHIVKKAHSYEVDSWFARNNISYSQESREPVLLYSYIALKVGQVPKVAGIDKLISSYNTLSTQYSRMIELDFYAKYCEVQIATYDPNAPHEIEKNDLIVNCLFTRFTMVRLLQIYGANYAIGHRYLAYTHYRIATLLTEFSAEIGGERDYVNDRLDTLLGYKAHTSIDRVYHYQRAKELYEQMLQLHSGGKEYRKMMADMVYLEDDFNDNAYHFGAALDRYFIVNDAIKKWIKNCDDEIRASGGYSVKSFFADVDE